MVAALSPWVKQKIPFKVHPCTGRIATFGMLTNEQDGTPRHSRGFHTLGALGRGTGLP